MTQLTGLQMMGIRSIGSEAHRIEFLDPLTIIQGENGTGKTTTIEALSYVTTGSLPSGKLSSFIHNNKLAKKKRMDALVMLQFTDFRGNICTATKRMTATASTAKKITTRSDECTLHVKSPKLKETSTSPKIADFHKEEGELKIVLAKLPHVEKEQELVASLYSSMRGISHNIREAENELIALEEEKVAQCEKLKAVRREYEQCSTLEREIELKIKEINVTERSIAHIVSNGITYEGTKEELIHTLESIKKSSDFQKAETVIQEAGLERQKTEKKIKTLEVEQKRLQSMIGRADGKKMHYNSVLKNQKCLVDRIAEALGKSVETENVNDEITNFVELQRKEIADFSKVQCEKAEKLQKEADGLRTKIAELKGTYEITEKTEKNLKEQANILQGEVRRQQSLHYESEMNELESQFKQTSTRLDELRSGKGGNSIKLKNHLDSMDEKVDELKSGFTHDKKRPKWSDADVVVRLDSLKLDVTAMRMEVGQNETFNAEEAELVLKLDELQEKKEYQRENMKGLEVLKENLDDVKKKLATLAEERKAASTSIEPLRTELSATEAQIKSHSKLMETEKTKLSSKIQSVQHLDDQFKQINKELATLKKEMEDENVESIRQQLANAEIEVSNLRQQLERIAVQIADCNAQQQRVHSLEDQLRATEGREIMERLQAEVNELRSQCKRTSKEISAEVDKVNRIACDLERKIQHKKGSCDQQKKSEQELKSRLGNSSLKKCREDLKQLVMEKLTKQAAIEDLKNFSKVMDDSIISYHTQKMEQINIILSELWPSVYQGNDIETIQIRSQPAESSDKRKSYDYSVVMVVDGEELEMRDRCSAGQKMLASILIRVALTEVFSGNCPILALDEPTTNLDASKVENVGTMLKDLLDVCNIDGSTRRLQLIVITHDQRLVEHLYAACRPEYVYGLSKDEYGVSRIRQHTHIAEVCSQSSQGSFLSQN